MPLWLNVKGSSLEAMVSPSLETSIKERSKYQPEFNTQCLDLTNSVRLIFQKRLKTSLNQVKGGIHDSK